MARAGRIKTGEGWIHAQGQLVWGTMHISRNKRHQVSWSIVTSGLQASMLGIVGEKGYTLLVSTVKLGIQFSHDL